MTSVSSVGSATYTTSTTSASLDASGITEDEAVTEKVQPYLDQIDLIDEKVSANETKISAYQEMQSLVLALESAALALSNPVDSSSNVFDQKAASLTSSSSTDASSLLSATVGSTTATGTHTIVVDQLATAERLGSSIQTTETGSLGLSGSFTVGLADGTAATVSVTSDMSLEDIESAINDQSSTTGVTASIIAVSTSSSDPEYELVLTGASTGQSIDLSTTSGSVLSDLGVTDSDGSTAATVLQAAQDAVLEVDGVTGITRATNDISDLLAGVTLSLTAADPSTTITMGITADSSAIETAISDFASAYNDWRDFVNENQATNSDGTAASTATLFGDSTLRDVSSEIDNIITAMVDDVSLSDIGLSLNSSNEFEIDESTMAEAVTSDLSSVQSLFEYQATTSNGSLTLAGHGSSTLSADFTVDIEVDASGDITSATATDADGDVTSLTVSGHEIIGPSDSDYAGLTFYYAGTTSATVAVTTSQGIADQLYQATYLAGNSSTGTIQDTITQLQDEDTTYESRVAELQDEANTYADYLLSQYATLEATVSEANLESSVLQELMSYDTSSS